MAERFVSKRFARFTGEAPGFAKTDYSFIPADFNGDGKSDYVMFTPSGGCDDGVENHNYGSRGGPPTEFVISTPTGYQAFEGFGGWVDAKMIQRRGSRDVLVFSQGMNGRCGFVRDAIWGWTGSGVDVVERRNERGQIVDKEGCPATAAAPAASANRATGWAKATFPPLPQGTYAWSTGCAQAARDPDFPPLMRLTARSWSEMDGASPILGIENNGHNRYRFLLQSEDEEGRKSRNFTEIRIIDGSTFESNGRTLRHCAVDYGARLGL